MRAVRFFRNAVPLLAIILLDSCSAPAVRRETPTLTVAFRAEDGMTLMRLEASTPFTYQDFFLSNPERLVIDCIGITTLLPGAVPIPQGMPFVLALRTLQFDQRGRMTTRCILVLTARCSYWIENTPRGILIIVQEKRPLPNGIGYDEDRLARVIPKTRPSHTEGLFHGKNNAGDALSSPFPFSYRLHLPWERVHPAPLLPLFVSRRSP